MKRARNFTCCSNFEFSKLFTILRHHNRRIDKSLRHRARAGTTIEPATATATTALRLHANSFHCRHTAHWRAGISNRTRVTGHHKRVELTAKYMARLKGLMQLSCNRATKFITVPQLWLLSSLLAWLAMLNLNASSSRVLIQIIRN